MEKFINNYSIKIQFATAVVVLLGVITYTYKLTNILSRMNNMIEKTSEVALEQKTKLVSFDDFLKSIDRRVTVLEVKITEK